MKAKKAAFINDKQIKDMLLAIRDTKEDFDVCVKNDFQHYTVKYLGMEWHKEEDPYRSFLIIYIRYPLEGSSSGIEPEEMLRGFLHDFPADDR